MPPHKRNAPGRAAAAAPAGLPTCTEQAAAHIGDPTLPTREARALLDFADTKPLRDALRKLGVEFGIPKAKSLLVHAAGLANGKKKVQPAHIRENCRGRGRQVENWANLSNFPIFSQII